MPWELALPEETSNGQLEYHIIQWGNLYYFGLTPDTATSWVLSPRKAGWFSREEAERHITVITILEEIEDSQLQIRPAP